MPEARGGGGAPVFLSMDAVSDWMLASASSIVASRSPIVRFELVMASSFSFASSSHHEVYLTACERN